MLVCMRLLHGSCEPRLETMDTPRHQRSITWVRRRGCWHIRRQGRRHLDCGALRRSLSRGERGTLWQDEAHLKSTQVGQYTHAGGLEPVGACVHLDCGGCLGVHLERRGLLDCSNAGQTADGGRLSKYKLQYALVLQAQ